MRDSSKNSEAILEMLLEVVMAFLFEVLIEVFLEVLPELLFEICLDVLPVSSMLLKCFFKCSSGWSKKCYLKWALSYPLCALGFASWFTKVSFGTEKTYHRTDIQVCPVVCYFHTFVLEYICLHKSILTYLPTCIPP